MDKTLLNQGNVNNSDSLEVEDSAVKVEAVKGDEDSVVKGDEDSVVKGDEDSVIKGDEDSVIKGDEDSVVKGDEDSVVKGDEDSVIKGDEDSVIKGDEAVLVGNKDEVVSVDSVDEVVPKIPKLPSNYSRGDVIKKPELTYKQTRGLGIVARIAFKGLNLYRLTLFSVIVLALTTTYAEWASWGLMVSSLFWVSIGIQLIVGLLYLGLMVAVRGQDVVFQGKLKFMDVDVWRILSFWQHLRDNVVKDILIINSVLVIVSSLLMMKLNNII